MVDPECPGSPPSPAPSVGAEATPRAFLGRHGARPAVLKVPWPLGGDCLCEWQPTRRPRCFLRGRLIERDPAWAGLNALGAGWPRRLPELCSPTTVRRSTRNLVTRGEFLSVRSKSSLPGVTNITNESCGNVGNRGSRVSVKTCLVQP